MPWFCFDRDWDFRPTRRIALAYKAGATLLITTAAAQAAETAGVGRRVAKPKGYADGGMVGPGLYLIGERGPETIVPGARVGRR